MLQHLMLYVNKARQQRALATVYRQTHWPESPKRVAGTCDIICGAFHSGQ